MAICSETSPSFKPQRVSFRAMVIWAGLCVVVTWAVCRLHPYHAIRTNPQWLEFPWIDAWICLQASFMILPLLLIYWLLQKRNMAWMGYAVSALMLLPSVIVLLNAVVFGWVGRRVLDYETALYFMTHGRAIAAHIPAGAIRLACYGVVGLTLFVAFGAWASRVTAKLWEQRVAKVKPRWLIFGLCSLCIIGSIPVFLKLGAVVSQMRAQHTRHLLTVLGIVKPNPPVFLSSNEDSGGQQVKAPPRGLAAEFRNRIASKDERLKQLKAVSAVDKSPDVLMVIIESMRPELVDESIMPNLSSLASRGIHCKSHFSGGNATTHGMFALYNGIDSIWYQLAVRTDPLLTRIFRSAGYETGFFAGHDDWREFKMDGFVNSSVFDRFQISPRNWLASDRDATQRAVHFLDADPATRKPRLAVLYLYSTHADYRSYATDQTSQPAARDGYLIPYTHSMRDQVWNRYENSARSVDRLLASVLSDERIVVVTGDHGESFLEDEVCGHGTKLNQFQNMTPAVVYIPGGDARTISVPTSHADLLPTILDAAKIKLSDPTAMDGRSLLDEIPSDRILLTRNYLDDDLWLVSDSNDGVAYRFAIRTTEWTSEFLGAEKWSERARESRLSPDQLLQRWIDDRLPESSR